MSRVIVVTRAVGKHALCNGSGAQVSKGELLFLVEEHMPGIAVMVSYDQDGERAFEFPADAFEDFG